MKKLCIFLIFKAVELLGIIFIPYWLGLLLPYAKYFELGCWLNGLLAIAVPIVVLFGLMFVFYAYILQSILYWLRFNWRIVYGREARNPFEDLILKLY